MKLVEVRVTFETYEMVSRPDDQQAETAAEDILNLLIVETRRIAAEIGRRAGFPVRVSIEE